MQSLDQLKESPSQTAGPYVHIGLTPNIVGIGGIYEADLGTGPLYSDGAMGERITIKGCVLDGTGTVLRDGLIEIWQADAAGLYPGPSEPRGTADIAFRGWGRTTGDLDTGEYTFETIKPGRVPHPAGGWQAPHISVWIVARGINLGLTTRIYFADEAAANGEDPILARIEHQNRIATLLAVKEGSIYRFDIRLQGEGETIFFDS